MPVAAASVGRATGADAASRDPAKEAARLLSLLADPSQGVADIAAHVRDLGPKGLAAAFARLTADEAQRSAGGEGETTRRRVREAVVTALWFADTPVRVQILWDALSASADTPARLAVLDVLTDRPRPEDVSLAVASVRHGPGAHVGAEVYDLFESCLVAMIRHDVRSLDALRTAAVWRDPDAVLRCARAIATAGRWEGIDVLLTAMDDPGLESSVVPSLAQLASMAPPRLRERPVTKLRDCLSRTDEADVCAAVLGLGVLRDEGSVPALIALADGQAEAPRDAAFWALRKISGLELRSWAHRWKIWYGDERKWSEEHAEESAAALASGRPDRIVAALAAVRGRTLGRAEWAKRLSPLLESPSAEIRMLTCDAMQALASDAAVPALAKAMHSDDAQLAAAATGAIQAITGRPAAELVAAWRRELDR